MTQPGIETATFLLVAQCLNQLRHRRKYGCCAPACRNITAVCCENDTKHANRVVSSIAVLLLKQVVCIVTIVNW